MIEHEVATYIAGGLGLVLGDDVWVQALPPDQDHGICVRVESEGEVYGKFRMATLLVLCVYGSYYDARSKADSIAELLKGRMGVSDENWGTGGKVELVNFGANEKRDYLVAVLADIFYVSG